MRHPHHPSLRIPDAFVALREHLLAGYDPESGEMRYEHVWRRAADFFCGELDAELLGDDLDAEPHPELSYHHWPVELIPFCHNGGDGLRYAWAVLAPELDPTDHPCASFAPVDDSACWLGDTAHQGLENLLAAPRRDGPRDGDPRWTALCTALDLHPPIGSPDITAGARSPRPLAPAVPPGWHYEPSRDGVGVLAPASAFAPEPVELDDWWDRDERVARAVGLIAQGHPASAIDVLKWSYPELPDMLVLRDAYRALGRDLHAERAEIWVSRRPT